MLRLGKRLSQEALALECDLDRTYVSGIERGRRNVSLRNIAALAHVLNVSLSEMFEGVDGVCSKEPNTLIGSCNTVLRWPACGLLQLVAKRRGRSAAQDTPFSALHGPYRRSEPQKAQHMPPAETEAGNAPGGQSPARPQAALNIRPILGRYPARRDIGTDISLCLL